MERNGMIIRKWKGMEWNRMYLSKGKEWNGILFGSNMEGMELNLFMTILLLDSYFKIKS